MNLGTIILSNILNNILVIITNGNYPEEQNPPRCSTVGFFCLFFFKNIFPKYKNREKLYIYKIIYICPLLYICTAIWNRNGYFILRMSENKLVLWIFFLRKTKYSQRLENIYVFKYELQVSILA